MMQLPYPVKSSVNLKIHQPNNFDFIVCGVLALWCSVFGGRNRFTTQNQNFAVNV